MDRTQYNLKPGTLLDQYEIIRVLGRGSFGITYLVEDTNLNLEVVIEEYLTSSTDH